MSPTEAQEDEMAVTLRGCPEFTRAEADLYTGIAGLHHDVASKIEDVFLEAVNAALAVGFRAGAGLSRGGDE